MKEYFIFGADSVKKYKAHGPSKNSAIIHTFDPHFHTGSDLINAFRNAGDFVSIPREHYNIISGNQRFCSCCGKQMSQGYVLNQGEAYFCETGCMSIHIPDWPARGSEIQHKIWQEGGVYAK